MDLDDPFLRRKAKNAVKILTISKLNGDLGVSRAIGDAVYKVRSCVCRSFPGHGLVIATSLSISPLMSWHATGSTQRIVLLGLST